MNFDDLIRLKALQLKAVTSGQSTTAFVEAQLSIPEVANGLKLRQVCAMVSPDLFRELEGTCELLSVSKRQFVEAALIEAIDKAGSIVSDVDPFTRQGPGPARVQAYADTNGVPPGAR